MKELQDEVAELKDNIEELRAALESETLAKVDYQNNLQSVTEDLAFRKKVYEEVRTMSRRSTNSGLCNFLLIVGVTILAH